MTHHRIAVVGGTGPQGKGLGYRWARAGHEVVLGSRDAERAESAAAEIRERVPEARVSGAANVDAVVGAEVVLLAVPYAGHDELVTELAEALSGSIVISCVNPLGFDKQGPYGLEVERSAAESAAALVPGARVVGGFHHVAAASLWSEEDVLGHEDVLVCGDDTEAKQVAIALARCVTGHDGVDAGRLRLARQLEPLTAVLISVNKRYKTRSGIAVTGLRDRA